MAKEKARKRRLAIGGSSLPANDSLYELVANDTGVTVTWTNEVTQVDVLGSDNKIADLGSKDLVIKGTVQRILTDDAFDDIEAAFHAQSIIYAQVRKDVDGVVKKELTGPFYVSSFEAASATTGVTTASYELVPAGAITAHSPAAALTSA